MQEAGELFRLLGDPVRLRLLRVLSGRAARHGQGPKRTSRVPIPRAAAARGARVGVDGRLNVTELTMVLGIAQSGVSRHLKLLKDAGLVVEERGGGFSYYRLAPALLDGGFPPQRGRRVGGPGFPPQRGRRVGGPGFDGLWTTLQAQFAAAADTPEARADEARLQEVVRLRKENFAVHGTDRGQFVPGRSWAAWSRALGFLLPRVVVADLACGEGYLTIEAARWARQVIGVDRSPEVLKRARALARRRGVRNVVWKQGDIERLPIEDQSIDVALLSQALHHAVEPSQALAEASRILRPGGHLLLLDLREHDQGWVRDRVGDRWLGFKDDELEQLLRGAGLSEVRVRVGARLAGDPFTVLIATGTKTSRQSSVLSRQSRDHRPAATRPLDS